MPRPEGPMPALWVPSTGEAFDLLPIPGGIAQLGTDRPVIATDGEGPMRAVLLKPFRIGAAAVSNAEFARFADATNYRTEAERKGASFVFHGYVLALQSDHRPVEPHWWHRVGGASWRQPAGAGSSMADRMDHPVVHVSRADASAYCEWSRTRLPSEAEWEHAARGGLGDVTYPWGDRAPDDDFLPCNIWQGQFPTFDQGLDGWTGTAPVRAFDPNGYGLYQACGNVWEWTQEPAGRRGEAGDSLLKGGSHLCHASYCHRYRIAARMACAPATTTSHIGFRVCR